MDRILKRPMFRKGGSAGEGITSGLQRSSYANGKTVEEIASEIREQVGSYNPRSNLNDFLIDFGLNMVGNAPTGNIFQTAATQAREPFKNFRARKSAEADLAKKINLQAFDIKESRDQSALDRSSAEKIAALKNRGTTTKGFEFLSKQETLSKLQDGEDIINEKIKEIKINPIPTPGVEDDIQNQLSDLRRELEKNRNLQKLITGENDMIAEALLKSIAADGDYDLNDYLEYKKDPDAFMKKIRENKADGGIMTGVVEEVEETGTTNPVADLTYGELRARLPKEINNDVVNILANSKQALLDFANIRTQQDVDEFNQQYSVNLVLPQEG